MSLSRVSDLLRALCSMKRIALLIAWRLTSSRGSTLAPGLCFAGLNLGLGVRLCRSTRGLGYRFVLHPGFRIKFTVGSPALRRRGRNQAGLLPYHALDLSGHF